MNFNLYDNNNILLIVLILLLILLGILLVKLRFFTFSRVIYFCLIICNLSVIFGRFACESLKCLFNLPNYFFQKYYAYGNLIPDNCEQCKPDWSLRNGVDEGGLILLGLVFVLIVLWIKNENLATLISKISKISFLGTVELENLNKKIEKYQENNNLTLNSTIEHSLKEEDEITIEKANTPDERLDLICNLIEKRIRELYTINNSNQAEIPTKNEAIIEKLENDKIINNDLKNILITFFKYKTENSLKRNGKFTFGLIELGRKIIRLLRNLLRKVFTQNKTFYGEVEEVKFDRTKFENISEDNIVITTTVSLADSNDNYFPLQSLSIQNFKLVETFENIRKEVNIDKVEEIANSNSRLGIVIAIDCSSSMNNNQKLIKSKEAINILFKDLLSYNLIETHVLIATFGNDSFSYIDNKWFNLRQDVDYLKTKIDSITANGNTPLYDAIMNIYNLFDKHGFNSKNNVIICLSDGENTENKDLFRDLSKKVKLMKIPIISIGFENNNYSKLIKLSELSGAGEVGVGYFVGINPIDLIGIFSEIVFTITKSYRISWKPSFLEYQKRIKVILEVNYLTQHGKNKKSEIEIEYEIEKE